MNEFMAGSTISTKVKVNLVLGYLTGDHLTEEILHSRTKKVIIRWTKFVISINFRKFTTIHF